MSTAAAVILLGGGGIWPSPRPRPARRAPLPPFDAASTDPESGAALPVTATLNGRPPAPSVSYRRENFCGLRVPGLPFIPGGAADPSLVFFPFIDRYTDRDQGRILDAYLQAGYTHGTLSWPDSRAYGKSVADYVATARRLKASGLWVCHKFFSKYYDPKNADGHTAFPVLDALLAADAIDCGTPAWEMNLFTAPEAVDDLVDPLAEYAPSVLWYLHFSCHYAAWQRNTETPHEFWMRRVGKVRGLEYQCFPVSGVDDTKAGTWSAGMMQARINDVLVRLAPGGVWRTPGFDVIPWETTAQLQFNGAQDERHGDLRGYESLCAPGPMPLAGFGNGARYPNGDPL